MRRIRLQVAITLLAVTVLFGVVAYLALSVTTETAPDYGGTYVEGVAGNPEVINQVIGDLGRGGVLEIVGDPQMQTSPDGQWRFTAIAFLRGASNVQA